MLSNNVPGEENPVKKKVLCDLEKNNDNSKRKKTKYLQESAVHFIKHQLKISGKDNF